MRLSTKQYIVVKLHRKASKGLHYWNIIRYYQIPQTIVSLIPKKRKGHSSWKYVRCMIFYQWLAPKQSLARLKTLVAGAVSERFAADKYTSPRALCSASSVVLAFVFEDLVPGSNNVLTGWQDDILNRRNMSKMYPVDLWWLLTSSAVFREHWWWNQINVADDCKQIVTLPFT